MENVPPKPSQIKNFNANRQELVDYCAVLESISKLGLDKRSEALGILYEDISRDLATTE